MRGHSSLSSHQRVGTVWDAVLRSSGGGLLLLLIIAYITGEEYQHTHMMIGYGIAAVVIANLYWELVHPRRLYLTRTHASQAFSANLRNALKVEDTPAFIALSVLGLASILGTVALILMAATHLWAVPMVDEMHEAIAYVTLGLVVLHIAIVVIASADHLERRLVQSWRRHG